MKSVQISQISSVQLRVRPGRHCGVRRRARTTHSIVSSPMDTIRDFPTLDSMTDIRSWFSLVNQVANYAQLRDTKALFRPFLSPNWRKPSGRPNKP